MKPVSYVLSVLSLVALGAFALPVCAADSVPPTVMALLDATPDVHQFAALAHAAGLKDYLSDPKAQLTVFAPTDKAMDKIPAAMAQKIHDDKEAQKLFVSHHILVGAIVRAATLKGRHIAPFTLAGQALDLDGTGEKVTVNKGALVHEDLRASNGMVQVVDVAMIPASFLAPAAPPVADKPLPRKDSEPTLFTPTKPVPAETAKPGIMQKILNFFH